MGAIRWTGKGLKLVGELLAAEEVEKWVEDKGRQYFESKVQGLTLKWIAGHNRATSKVFAEISESIDSDTFRSALAAALETLAGIIESWGDHIEKARLKDLYYEKGSSSNYLTIVPRAVVRREYSQIVVSRLNNSAELARFEFFPELFLSRQAQESEDVFFRNLRRALPFVCPSKKRLILAIDERFDWEIDADSKDNHVCGHYYVASPSVFDNDLTDSKVRRRFVESMQVTLEEAKVALGSMTTEAKTVASQALTAALPAQ